MARLLKRLMDIAGAFIGLSLSMPLFLAVVAAVKISSPGPVFFKQRRIGYRGEPFYILKFRTMRADHVPEMVPVRGPHPHLTRVGKFLRDSSLDELPQFLNVLVGDMSLVGPRPLADYHASHYEKVLPIFKQRLAVRPGITGAVQVSDIRNNSHTLEEVEEQLKLDAAYVQNWSLMRDLQICWQTLALLFARYNAAKQAYKTNEKESQITRDREPL